MKRALVLLMQAYRYAISPMLGRHCRFEPSCSAYSIEALETHGALKGAALSAARLCRCHPWCTGGFDPVPPGTPKTSKSFDFTH